MDFPCDQFPRSYISEKIAKNRKEQFVNEKKPVLNTWIRGRIPRANEEAEIKYTVEQFKSLLEKLSGLPHDVTGLRIYYGCYLKNQPDTDKYLPSGKEDRLCLIYSPTRSNGDQQEDIGEYYIIKHNNGAERAKPIEQETASDWVSYYQSFKLKKLQKHHRNHYNPNFEESKSIWFPIKDILDWKCIMENSGKHEIPIITAVSIFFTSYSTKGVYKEDYNDHDREYERKLGIVITMWDKEDIIKFERISWFKERFLERNLDTGSPCPPDRGCKTGSKLPTA